MDPGRVYPRCTGGRRAGPPEASGGVRAFLEQTQPHHVLAATLRAVEILSLLLEAEDLTRFGEHRDELATPSPAAGCGPVRPADSEPCLGSTARDRGEGGMKITVQIVLHADDDTPDRGS